MNKVTNRTLSVQDVIDLVNSVPISVRKIERDLGIAFTVLGRAMRYDTTKPLPVKYEKRLIDYIKLNRVQAKEQEKKTVEVLVEAGVDVPEEITDISPDEKSNKIYWLNEVRTCVKPFIIQRVTDLLTK